MFMNSLVFSITLSVLISRVVWTTHRKRKEMLPMKARESVANYAEQLEQYSDYVQKQTAKVIAEVGPRESAEASERAAQDYVAEHMTGVADEVAKEEFDVHPKAFMGWVLIDGILMILSALLLTLTLFGVVGKGALIAAFIMTLISVALILGEFLFYKEFLDPFFPKRTTYNVLATRKAAGETKRRVVIAGHIDSAYEWYYTYLGGGKFLTTMLVYEIGSLVLNLVLDILVLCGVGGIVMKILAIITIPAFICVLFFVNWFRVVPGANDNLTGVFAAMAVLRYFVDNDIRLEHTEIIAAADACEEAGLRGAKAFAKKHAAEYQKEYEEKGIETICIAVDTLRDYDYMGIYNKDMSGTVKLDAEAAALVKKASSIAGLDLDYANVFFGSSDAAALQQGGLKACCLAAMDPTPSNYYHTRRDTPDNMDPRCIVAGVDTLLEAVYLFDEKGFAIDD